MRKLPVVLILENIRSAQNVGSIFRTSECAGIEKIYLTGITPYPKIDNDNRLPWVAQKAHQMIDKTALGAQNLVEWEHFAQVDETLAKLKENGYHIIALEKTTHSQNLYQYSFSLPLAFILGNEVVGVEPQTLNQTDAVVEIPMFGRKESLNVSVATAIAVYEIVRQFGL